jgi:hypothetical protein
MFWTLFLIFFTGFFTGSLLGAATLAFFMGVKSGDQREPG